MFDLMRFPEKELSRTFSNFFKDFYDLDFGYGYSFQKIKDNFVLTVELPGIRQEDLKVNVTEDIISIEGITETEYYKKKISKRYSIPADIDETKIEAKYKDGLLVLVMPTKKEQKKAIKINV